MKRKGFAIARVLFAIMIALAFLAPMNFASAAKGSQSVTECWQNPEAEGCEDSNPAAEDENSTSANVGLGLWDYMKMLFSLVFVLALLIFVLKFLNKKSASYQQNSVVQNIGGISVGAQKSVQLLHIGDKLYIVGVGDDVQLIKEIDNPEEIERLLEIYNEKQSFVDSTSPYILDLVKKLRGKNTEEQTEEKQSNQNFGEMFNKRLTELTKTRKSELDKWKEKERDK
ncbi:flagellar biosynthetic protein FliO [Ureibacillus chungkukjangi]|uniref:flagellar biosynthetic protein FliO n=1 Tax=Ureibacillus chungkukjangi TaxID=1202712 RepID=UPI00203B98CB|nr:flagellar biosynthetic protein FliO [Ureibacillus chungkukjangi]MCM3386763.1 flagellar biosynthetic protein FliO [Ureibacillus chungkukjangi]